MIDETLLGKFGIGHKMSIGLLRTLLPIFYCINKQINYARPNPRLSVGLKAFSNYLTRGCLLSTNYFKIVIPVQTGIYCQSGFMRQTHKKSFLTFRRFKTFGRFMLIQRLSLKYKLFQNCHSRANGNPLPERIYETDS